MKDVSDVGRSKCVVFDTIWSNELDLALWRSSVDRNLKGLAERITLLEMQSNLKKNDGGITLLEMQSNLKKNAGECIDSWDSEAEKGYLWDGEGKLGDTITTSWEVVCEECRGCCGCRKTRRLVQKIKSSPTARFQCLWLIVCIIVFLLYGVTYFIRAEQNEQSNYKPTKIRYVKDFTDETSSDQYKMPTMYVHFTATWLDVTNTTEVLDGTNITEVIWSESRINETLTELLESQNYFEGRVLTSYFHEDFSETHVLHDVEAVSGHWEETWIVDAVFWGWIEIKISDPPAAAGSWIRQIFFTNFTNERVTLTGWSVSLDREFSSTAWLESVPFSYEDDIFAVFEVVYTEIVFNMLEDSKIIGTAWQFSESDSVFEASLNGVHYWDRAHMEFLEKVHFTPGFANLYNTCDIGISLMPDLRVEHWEEYVEYDFWDWLAAMGGMLSLLSIIFYRVAYCVATSFGKSSLGILKHMSLIYDHHETINWMKPSVLPKMERTSTVWKLRWGNSF